MDDVAISPELKAELLAGERAEAELFAKLNQWCDEHLPPMLTEADEWLDERLPALLAEADDCLSRIRAEMEAG